MKTQGIKIYILTLFPKFVSHYTEFGIIAKAISKGLLTWKPVDIRESSPDARGTVDDRPYGGGVGMVLRPDVLYAAIEAVKNSKFEISSYQRQISPGRENSKQIQPARRSLGEGGNPKSEKFKTRTVLLTPQGKPFKQAHAKRLSKYENLVFVCGRYEGFDERIRKFVDEEFSIGDYVLMGGELPAMVMSEAILRLVPGVIGKLESTENESFSSFMLEYPQYTKPEKFEVVIRNKKKVIRKKMVVPKVLLSGNHAKVNAWREAEALKRTKKRRPDLLGSSL